MEAPSLFVGLVTHEGTRFAVSRSNDGLAAGIHRRIPGAVFQVEARDLWLGEDIGEDQIRACHATERKLERHWLTYLGASRAQRLGVLARHAVGRGRDLFSLDPSSLTRLLNIELSHHSLWRAALDSRAPWVLILEDDGWTQDVDDFVAGIMGVMQESAPPSFANLSTSFSHKQLRIEHLLRAGRCSWRGDRPRAILESVRPVTNTVCAVLYSAEFLEDFVEEWDAQPMFPVVPIDWKMNRILMNLHESHRFPPYGCWFVDPGPVIQGSMRAPAKMLR